MLEKTESKILNNKLVLITGASKGIGRASAEIFAKQGYDLALNCAKSVQLLEDLSDRLIKEYGIKVNRYVGDVSDYEFVETMIDKVYSDFGKVDVLINNAGISYISLLTDMQKEDWHRVIDVNLSSVFYTCSLVVPNMVRVKMGRIINISSIWGEVGASCEVAYSAAKGGVIAFTKALAKELAPSNITVNAVSFGVIDTDMNSCFDDEERDNIINEISVGRMGRTDEAARVIYDLAEAPMFLTAQVIRMDGGML